MTAPAPADGLLEEGRSLVRINLWRIFWVTAFVAWLGGRAAGEMLGAALRVVATALLCYLVYRGRRWALWALGAYAVIAGAFMVVLAFVTRGMEPLDRALLGIGGAVQVAAFVVLVRAPAVVAFMRAQRELRRNAGP